MTDELKYVKNGICQSIYCASYGLLIALFINVLIGTFLFIFEFPLPIALGILGLYVWALIFGGAAGRIVHELGPTSFTVWIIGVLLAWSSILAMALAGSSFYFFKELRSHNFGNTFFDYIIKPAIWILLVGFIPALILGLWWARQMKRTLISNDL